MPAKTFIDRSVVNFLRPWRLGSFAMMFAMISSSVFSQQSDSPQEAPVPALDENLPMLQAWDGPYGGVPPWDKVDVNRFEAAFEVALARATSDIQEIASQEAKPTIENTILALDSAGAALERLDALFSVHTGNLNLGPIPTIERSVSPKLSEFADSIVQNPKIFSRIEAIYKDPALKSETAVRRRLVEDRYQSFVRQGANLSDGDKAKLTEINSRLATLFTDFNQNVLEDEKRYVTWINDASDLAGLPESTIAAMVSAAKERQESGGKWAVTNTRSSIDPFLTYSDSRLLREQVWRNFYSRCDHGDKFDNKPLVAEILSLRTRRAKLLGYPTHAAWRMQRTMAASPENAMALMMRVWPKAVARVREEVADMQRIADMEAVEKGLPKIKIEPWDYRYYAEKVRKEKYSLDFNEVEAYLQLDKLVDGMLWVASELFNLRFVPSSDFPVFHPDVRTWKVINPKQEVVGLFYLDPYAREGKRSGAWMTEYRPQHRQPKGSIPIVSNNSNFINSAEGQPVLISWDDATTLFHEFGHALHGLLSDVDYKAQAGTRVARDFVEFPSQIFEHWLTTEPVLKKFAVHYQTGQSLPEDLVKRIQKAKQFNQGFATVEYLSSAIMDMRLHTETADGIDPAGYERRVLSELGMPSELPMRHRLPHFLHLFSSDSYSAGYYSYLWSDALTADAAEAFEEAPGGYYDRQLADRLLTTVLTVGDTIDPADSYRRFRGRDVDTNALLRKRGFPVD